MAELKYLTGEAVLTGDIVEHHGDRGRVEFLVSGPTGDEANDWHLRTNGPGVMVLELEPKNFGRVYINDLEHDEDLLLCQGERPSRACDALGRGVGSTHKEFSRRERAVQQ